MDVTFLFYGSAVLLGVYLAVRKFKKEKKREDEYFRRMEEAFRRANDDKNKPD